jgi:hypothetical protein
MTAQHPSIGSLMEPPAPARLIYVGGPRDGRDDVLDVPGGVPTIIAVDEALGFYSRDIALSDGRRRMVWRGFEEVSPPSAFTWGLRSRGSSGLPGVSNRRQRSGASTARQASGGGIGPPAGHSEPWAGSS